MNLHNQGFMLNALYELLFQKTPAVKQVNDFVPENE